MQKNRSIFILFIIMSVWLSAALVPSYATAATSSAVPTALPVNIGPQGPNGMKPICPGNDTANPEKGFTIRLIPCIRDTIVFATSELMTTFSEKVSVVAGAMYVLALVCWGILLASGSSATVTQTGLILAIKIGFVIFLTNQFGGYYPKLLGSMDSMLNMMASPVIQSSFIWRDATSGSATLCTIGTFGNSQAVMTIWNILDCYLELFIGGIFSAPTITMGIIGFIIGMAFSTSVGMFIALAGVYMLMTAMFTIARTIYIFITSYIAFSFMILISCFFIPCILFKATKPYFDGWVSLTINFFIQPIFVVGYLAMFLVAFNVTILHGKYSLYYAIAGEESLPDGFQLGKWLSKGTGGSVYADSILAKDNMKVDPSGAARELGFVKLEKAATAVEDMQGARPAGSAAYGLGGTSPLNFFETGVEVRIVVWDTLAKKANTTAYDAAAANGEPAKEEYVKNYKMTLFLAFIMAAVFMYLFFSLLGYIPYIGNGAMGDSGVPLGVGALAPPGSKMFGGGVG